MIYKTETITINGQDITVKPLKGKHFGKFMAAASRMPKEGEQFDESVMTTMHELGVISLSESFPGLSADDIERIVTSNFSNIIKVIVSVNTPSE